VGRPRDQSRSCETTTSAKRNPGAVIPETLLACLCIFEPCFRSPSYARFLTLMSGWVLCVGRHTVTGIMRAAGVVDDEHSGFHRFFNRAPWSAHEVGLVRRPSEPDPTSGRAHRADGLVGVLDRRVLVRSVGPLAYQAAHPARAVVPQQESAELRGHAGYNASTLLDNMDFGSGRQRSPRSKIAGTTRRHRRLRIACDGF